MVRLLQKKPDLANLRDWLDSRRQVAQPTLPKSFDSYFSSFDSSYVTLPDSLHSADRKTCVCGITLSGPVFSATDYITGNEFRIVHCGRCGTGFTSPIPSLWESYYPGSYYGDSQTARFPAVVERAQEIFYKDRVDSLENMIGGKAGRVLDVGCGRGYLLNSFQRRGWDVIGTEISERAARFPREQLKLRVVVGELSALQFSAEHFDAVVLWHVLEHLADPWRTLREVYRIVRPGGIVFLGVPNFASFEAALSRDKWFHLDVPRHLNHFTPAGLNALLDRCGFDVVRSSYWAPEYDFFSALQSLLNRTGLSHNFLYNALRKKGAKTVKTPRRLVAQLAAHLLLLPLLSLPACALATVSPLLRKGATQSLWARRRTSALRNAC